MKIVDTHCHLNDEALYKDLDSVISRARQAGVEKMVVVGWDEASSKLAIQIAEQYDFIYAVIGFHPENVFDIDDKILYDTLNLYKHPKVVGIGEIGLDYHWTKDPDKREIQKEYFIKQIKFANEVGLPISIHSREAFADTLEILKQYPPLHSGVMHCYSGSVENIQDMINLNLYIGLDGPVTFTNAKTPKEVAAEVPLEKLVVETDCPYLSPHPLRGTVNEPKNIALVLDEVTRIKGLSKKHISDVIFKNSCKLFNIDYEENN
jgi:TatD DNase family protein